MSSTTEALRRNVTQYRSLGDTYAKIAAGTTYLPRKAANSAEAAKYYGLAQQVDAEMEAIEACGNSRPEES